MAVPLFKVLVTASRLVLRPINNKLINYLKTVPKCYHKYFIDFGNMTHRFDTRLTRAMLGKKGLSVIPDLSNSMAFDRGIEWFTEIVFFYFTLCSLTFWEMNRAEVARL